MMCATFDCRARDECPDRGMLAVARGVLMRVHYGVFEALAAPPVQTPDGTLVYGNWDVRHVLQQARRQVRRRLHDQLTCWPFAAYDVRFLARCYCHPATFRRGPGYGSS